MGNINLDKMRARLATLQGKNNRSTALWKPQEGNQVVRIVPYSENPSDPFIELYFHYIGGKTQLSPITNGNPDPIDE